MTATKTYRDRSAENRRADDDRDAAARDHHRDEPLCDDPHSFDDHNHRLRYDDDHNERDPGAGRSGRCRGR